MRGQEAQLLFNNAAAGSVTFELKGGAYVLDFVGTGAGTVDFYRLGPDQTTYISVMTQIAATTGTSGALALPPGQYKVTIATFTANYLAIIRVPGE